MVHPLLIFITITEAQIFDVGMDVNVLFFSLHRLHPVVAKLDRAVGRNQRKVLERDLHKEAKQTEIVTNTGTYANL